MAIISVRNRHSLERRSTAEDVDDGALIRAETGHGISQSLGIFTRIEWVNWVQSWDICLIQYMSINKYFLIDLKLDIITALIAEKIVMKITIELMKLYAMLVYSSV